ncbi:MAG: insulinase family protein [Ignavibacteriales bacterium]|nr:MAG: insulinase family protein [Ignavibacteriales bacterium]
MSPNKLFVSVLVLLLSFQISAQKTKTDLSKSIDIPFQKFVLDNGLTLIVHEDHKAPIVAVNIWYHVGSKNEKEGKTGFAHLFEHLMFNGSENFDGEYFEVMEKIGATDLNGTTNNDRTNYFQNVPTSALDVALWMESDRMGHLLGAINQEVLDEQRGVVQNEKRQGEDQPYGKVWNLITESTFPKGHPYSWTVIGSMDDLNAASLEDVHEWFKTYYGPNNAVIVLAGDITPQTALEKVEKYFGDIPPGPPIAKHQTWIPKMSGSHRQIMQDRVPQARIYKVWNVPQWGTKENNHLNLVSSILASGKTSRLYKRLVYDEQVATNVSSFVDDMEIAGQFYIDVTAKPGQDLSKIENAIDEELAALLKNGPTEKELQRVKTQYFAGFIRGIERIGGFGGKSDILASNIIYGGVADHYKTTLKEIESATIKDLKETANKWLSDGVFILEVHPFPEHTASTDSADRTKLPELGMNPEIKFPDVQRATLSNGLKIVLAERHSIPVVSFNLMVDAGYSADQNIKPGTAKLTMDVMDEGTKKLSALEISEQLNLLGANLSTGSNLDYSTVYLNALKVNLDQSLDLYADVILNSSFSEKEFDRLKKNLLVAIQREKATPVQMGLRVLPQLLYGSNHAYGNSFTGSGTEASVNSITKDDLVKFRNDWFKPNNATLVVVGDITMSEVQSKLEKLFKDWKSGTVPQKNVTDVKRSDKPVIYIMDRPGSQQSIIFAGHVAPRRSADDEIAIESFNNILGGVFTSRINMNLREDKHWSYGSFSILWGAKGQRPYFVYAPVQTDKTKEAMTEVLNELNDIKSTKPITDEEFMKDKNSRTLSLPGTWETAGSVSGSLTEIITYNLPDDYFTKYEGMVRSLTKDEVSRCADKLIHTDNLIWVVVGDKSKIEAGIKELGLGEVKYLDADGNVIK